MDKKTNYKIKEFIKEINEIGFKNAQKSFLRNNPKFQAEFIRIDFNQTADKMFHCYTENNNRCLDLSAGLGGGTISLSNMFNEVYCYELEDNLRDVLKARLEFSKKKNILLCKNLKNEITSKKDFFDLIICQDILKLIQYRDLREFNINSFLEKIFHSLSQNGRFCFGINSDDLLKFNQNTHDVTSNFEKKSDIDELKNQIITQGYKVEIFWALPSLEKPYYSGSITEDTSLIWYVKNLRKFVKEENLSMKQKTISLFKGKIGNKIIKLKAKNELKNFIFCCYKNNSKNSLEDLVKKETNSNDILMISRPQKVNFISFKNNQPTKIVNLSRYGKEFPTQIKNIVRTRENLENPKDRLWMEDWYDGTKLNLSNEKEVLLAIDWLINFQKNSRGDIISENEIKDEMNEITIKLQNASFGYEDTIRKWLNDYYELIMKNKILKTNVHGDFWINNILVNKSNTVNVIDWELFSKNGNPFVDFMKFFNRWLMKSEKNNIDAVILEKNLSDSSDFMNIYPKIKKKIDLHFGFKLDFLVILRYFVLRRISMKEMTQENLTTFTKIVDILMEKKLR